MRQQGRTIVRWLGASGVVATMAIAAPALAQLPLQVLFQPGTEQTATIDHGVEFVVSRQPTSEVRMMTSEPDENGRLELPFLVVNRSSQPITIGPENVSSSALTLVTYEQLMEQERRHEGHKKFGNFLARLGTSLGAINAGNQYGSFNYSGMSSGGTLYSGSGTLTLTNPYLQRQAEEEATATNAARTEQMYASFAAARHELGANLRTTTVMPGQQLTAVLTFDAPKDLQKAASSRPVTLTIQVGADQHVLSGFVGPSGSLPAIAYSTRPLPPLAGDVAAQAEPAVASPPAGTGSNLAEASRAVTPLPAPTEPTIEGYRRGEYTGKPAQLAALAKKGFGPAQYELGTLYQLGKGVPKDSVKAVQLFKLAAAQGVRDADTSLGWMYEKGDGVPRNVGIAVQYYALAAKNGDEIASSRLITLRSAG
jgi:hypothetical protein